MKFNIGILIGVALFAAVLLMSSCIFVAGTHQHDDCPVCEECRECDLYAWRDHKHKDCPVCGECLGGSPAANEEHLNSHCATNFEPDEDPYMCSKYYEDKEVPLPETGSFDFFLEEDDKITSSLIATKCLTCGIHFTHPSYGEHIKTCCP